MLEIISPSFNELNNIDRFIHETRASLSFHDIEDYLITIVDDGSDQSSILFYEKYRLDKDIRIILLARNYGHQVALLAGLENAKGDYILSRFRFARSIEIGIQMYEKCISEKEIADWSKGKTKG